MGKLYRKEAHKLVGQMTLEEKAGLCSGEDCWNTKAVTRLGLQSIMVSDGPHGLRKQMDSQDNLGIGESAPATCFPTASLTACSFDPSLIYEMGEAIALECKKQGVSVILGPGINMKRNPLCGRNFEYFSEDPYLAGKLATGYITGVQSKGVGCSLKHLAVNNQERRRMNVSAVVDQRTLHEIYLKAFKMAVKESNPWTVMCSYNKINGIYASENEELLTNILRKRWGYQGLVVSDWGAVHNRVDGIKAGLDLEMPGTKGVNDKKIIAAVSEGTLEETAVNQAAEHVTELVLSCTDGMEVQEEVDLKKHHQLAVKIAAESMVLLKNKDHCLPVSEENAKSIAVVGHFAVKPRFQGTGSSKICPIQMDIPLQELKNAGICPEYTDGSNVEETLNICRKKKQVIIFAGLPESSESEGVDRKHMKLPEEQNELIRAITEVNQNVCVVLMGGSPVELPWADQVQAILLAYLGGEGAGKAIAGILTGQQNPCGKLAETWPMKYEDVPGYEYFPGDRLHVLYPESIFMGYRYYDSVGQKTRYLFGHGLSYTQFVYSDLRIEKNTCQSGEKIVIHFRVKNTGQIAGKEISYVFMSHYNEKVYMPKHQLVAFCKHQLHAMEEKEITLEVDTKDFGYFNSILGDFYIDKGSYKLSVGGSLSELPLSEEIEIHSDQKEQPDFRNTAQVYYEMAYGNYLKESSSINMHAFEAILGHSIPEKAAPATKPYTQENCLEDVKGSILGRLLLKIVDLMVSRMSKKEEGQEQMMAAAVKEMPLFAIAFSSNGLLTEKRLQRILWLLNKF